MFNVFSEEQVGSNPWLGYPSVAFNVIASALLICALYPTHQETKIYKRTFAIDVKFWKFFFFGATAMFLNAVIMIIGNIVTWQSFKLAPTIMFCAFIPANITSMYVNFFGWKTKVRNTQEAMKLGISEQEYWEKYIAPTVPQPAGSDR